MTIINDIAYAGEPEPILKIRAVRPLDDYRLLVRFSTDEIKIFDFKPLLYEPAFLPLQDKTVFDAVYIDYGVPVWRDGENDIAPEKLYTDGVAVDQLHPV
ncbi:MAG: DUF2442 domain-containing protein [Acetobacterium sp.]|nr:DUF2442 domain-containing protein [Acetobacterium sp.]